MEKAIRDLLVKTLNSASSALDKYAPKESLQVQEAQFDIKEAIILLNIPRNKEPSRTAEGRE